MAKSKADYQERKKAAMFNKVDVWQQRIAGLLVFMILCVQPLYLNYYRYIRLTWHKFVFFVVYMCFILLFVLIVWGYRMAQKPRLYPQDKIAVLDWAVLGFAVVTLLSALVSPFKDYTDVWVGVAERYDGAISQLLYVAVYFIISRWYKPSERVFVWVGISAILVGAIGVLQFYGMDFLRLWPNHISEYYRPNFYGIFFRSTLGNVNIVSTYVCSANLLCGFLYVRKESKWSYIWLAGSAMSFWMMIVGGSFSGMVGTAGATFLAVPFIIENRKFLGRFLILGASWLATLTLQMLFYNTIILKTQTVGRLLLFVAAVCVLAAAGTVLLVFGKKIDPNAPAKWKLGVIVLIVCIVAGFTGVEVIGGRVGSGPIYQAREILHGNIDDTFGSNRVFIWRNALRAFPQRPVIGSGPDTFYYAFPAEAHGFYGESYDKAHNEYIQILICQGILGLLTYLVFLAGVFIKAIPKAFKNPLLMAVLAAFVGYCVQAFFNINLPIVSQFIWVFAGLLANKRFRELTPDELGVRS